jgi:hypothetical protein
MCKILQLHTLILKLLSLTIIQMRTEKIGLLNFLHQRQVPGYTDATCQCGIGSQTIQHILLACPLFNELRRETWEGEDGRRERLDLKKILNTPSKAKKAARFMILTRLLGQYGAVSENEIR